MNRHKSIVRVVLVLAAISLAIGQCYAQTQETTIMPQKDRANAVYQKQAKRVTQAEREAAAKRMKKSREQTGVKTLAPRMPMPGDTPDYFGVANWAFSPPLRKFVNGLPGLGLANANDLGQYIPLAVPDTTTYTGSDYYEIELRQYTEKMHSDLPPTTLRGYVQVKNGVDVTPIHYMEPTIIAQKDRPVRTQKRKTCLYSILV